MSNPWDADYKDPETGEAVYKKPKRKKPKKKKPTKNPPARPKGPGSTAEDVAEELRRRNKDVADRTNRPRIR